MTVTTLQDHFRGLLAKNPEKIALSVDGRKFSVSDIAREVEARSPGLTESWERARTEYLPLLVDRSAESILAVLTCLFKRIPFALLDGTAPPARIQAMLGLVDHPGAGWWGPDVAQTSVPKSLLSRASAPSARPQKASWGERVSSFVVTTSGSTGTPKGVVVGFATHDQRIDETDDVLSDGLEELRFSSFSPVHFVGGLNRLSRIVLGHEVHVWNPSTLTMSDTLRVLRDAEITHLSVPPQLGRLLAHYGNPEGITLPRVTHLRMGSEGIRFETLHGLKRYLRPEVVVRHGLGATEALRGMSHTFVLGEAPEVGQVPVGHLRPHARMTPLEDSEEGWSELWVAGAIAEGYLNQPELTAERFIVRDGVRYWRSGDLLALGEDGLHYHRGRMDDIVKVRGMLASPSEATRVLLGIEGVRAGIVLPQVHNHNTRLIAHVELQEMGEVPTVETIRQELQSQLPSHLVPASIVLHDTLPTTPRGKIDRVRLQQEQENLASPGLGPR